MLPEQYTAGISETKFKSSSLTGVIYLFLDVTANELIVQDELNRTVIWIMQNTIKPALHSQPGNVKLYNSY